MSTPDLGPLEDKVEAVASDTGDRYEQLVEVHDALRQALAETDSDPAAPGR